jgi:hypothetical protein
VPNWGMPVPRGIRMVAKVAMEELACQNRTYLAAFRNYTDYRSSA